MPHPTDDRQVDDHVTRDHPADDRQIDDHLRAWRDAAERGGLPRPHRTDRWQPLRAGVVNLWEFEVAEYWFADGWAQLSGGNETGKSSLMAMTTLVPWLGSVAGANIDTLGESSKTFRYYVEPSTRDDDRRPSDTSTSSGWLWVEYGRRREDGGEQFFTTAMFARARRAAAALTTRWCTIDQARVRADVDLVVNGDVQPPDALAGVVTAHRTGGAYREHVAQHLLGGDAGQLESIGKLLRVTRTPKLGERLNIGFVTAKMREALPELAETEVLALAEGWDQLDQVRADANSARDARRAVQHFRRTSWVPWVRARLRVVADAGATARTEFDAVTRGVREAQAGLARARRVHADLQEHRARLRTRIETEEGALAALRDSAAYRDAHSRHERLGSLRRELAEADSQAARAAEELADAAGRARASAQAVQRADEDLERARSAHERARAALRVQLREAHLAESLESDATRLGRVLADRQARLAEAETLHREVTRTADAAGTAEEHAAALGAEATSARRAAEEAWASAETGREEVAAAVARWAAQVVPLPAPEHVDAWVAGLPGAEEMTEQATERATEHATERATDGDLRAAVHRDWFVPAETALVTRLATVGARVEEHVARAADLRERYAALEAQPEPVAPEASGWLRRERPAPGDDGAPLWRLVNPRDGVDEPALAGLEAALAAAGLLDAWVTPDGAWIDARDGAEAVLTPGRHPEDRGGEERRDTLATLLEPSASPLAGVVEGVLGAVALLGQPGGEVPAGGGGGEARGGYGVASDGRWRTPLLTGRADPVHGQAELVGQEARERSRRRRLAELAERIAEAEQVLADARATQGELVAARDRLARDLDQAPDDAPLRRLVREAGTRAARAEDARGRTESARERALGMRERADVARAAQLEHAADHQLPTTRDELAHLRRASERVTATLPEVRGAEAGVDLREEARARAQEHARVDEDARSRRSDAAEGAHRRAAGAREQVATLEATVDADDRQILDEARRREEYLARARRESEESVRQMTEAVGEEARLEGDLARAEGDREAAQRRRDATYADFHHLLDAGLAGQIDLELPNADARSIEATRAQVAAVREAVSPRDWPADPDEQRRDVELRFQRLTTGVVELRGALEAGGRSVRMEEAADPPRIDIVVDASGAGHEPREAQVRLEQIRDQLSTVYDERMRAVLGELLGSTFIDHLRERLGAMRTLVAGVNGVLRAHATGTTRTSLRLKLVAHGGATAEVLSALEDTGGTALLDERVAGQVREFLRALVEGAKESAGAEGRTEWTADLATALDYREWFDIALEKRSGAGAWSALTPSSYANASGGARAVMLMTPLIATLAALYSALPGAPRPLWLDEAFDGLDADNRAMVLSLLREFDLDVLVAGPGRLLNSVAVPAAAIYQVVRAPHPQPGADLLLELWAGRELSIVDLPAPSSRATPGGEDAGGSTVSTDDPAADEAMLDLGSAR